MHRVILFSGPSGVGKTTIVNLLTKNRGITSTSREPRAGEIEGKDYFFLTKEEFLIKIEKNEMVEYAKYDDNYYGLSIEEYNRRLEYGDLYIVCDAQGMRSYKERNPQSISIFISSSAKEVEMQLRARGDSEKSIQERLDLFRRDLSSAAEYDMIFDNNYGQLNKTVDEIKKQLKNLST